RPPRASACLRAYTIRTRGPDLGGAIRHVIAPLAGAVTAGLVAMAVLYWGPDAETRPEKPAAASGEYVIGQFNMAGGTTEHGAKRNGPPDAFAEDVKNREPAFVAMQETCRDWDERLEERLPGFTVVFSPVRNLARNPGSPA